MSHPERPSSLTFIGFGEAARAFLSGWGDGRPANIRAYDRKTDRHETATAMRAAYTDAGIAGADSAPAAVKGAPVVFSVVTADQALIAAQEAGPHLAPGTLWLDCNSCAPETKRAAAAVIDGAGGRYVDVAVMAPVHPARHRVPLLLSGAAAGAARDVILRLDMRPDIVGDTVGQASSIKMLRSVMIKGLEALTAECFLAARKAGVADQVLASLERSDPDIAWRRRGAYNLERMTEHGARRAAEMAEVAKTVAALGLPNAMSRATTEWQETMAARSDLSDTPDLDTALARVLDRL